MATTAAHTQVLALDPLPLGIVKIGRHGSRLELIGGLVTILVNGRRHFHDSDVGDPPLHTECAGASLVIRLTTCAAGSDGGMIGAGGGVCAIDWIATVNVVSAIAPAMALRISSSRYYFAIKNVSRIVRAADREIISGGRY